MAKGDPRSGGAGGGGYFPAIYQSAMAQSAGDYDNIMKQYQGLADRSSRGGSSSGSSSRMSNYSPITPQFSEYQPGSNYDDLRNLAKTGGFSDDDIGNIRARSVSPIRSIYDNANRNLLRQKNLQGGYSPNYGAASAKMARESSNLIGERTTATNAGIAEMVQRGKLAGATALAPLEAQEAARRQQFNDYNTNIANQAAMFNAQGQMDFDRYSDSQEDNDFDKIFKSIQGQQSLYGTTPALASTFGNQVLNAANTMSGLPPVMRNMPNPSSKGGIRDGNPWAKAGDKGARAY